MKINSTFWKKNYSFDSQVKKNCRGVASESKDLFILQEDEAPNILEKL